MTTLSEDTLIFNALTPEITDMQKVYIALEEFMKIKKENDASDRFNVIIFQEYGPNYLNDFTLNPENILMALKSLEPTIEPANIASGIFVAITFIIEVYKRISQKAFRLIILTDSGTLKIPEKYMPVLDNLIDMVKNMPFYIDIVRIDTDDPGEDKKLMELATRCYGNVHEINDLRDLESILEVLALKREIPEETFYDKEKKIISKTNQAFYINLADDVEDAPKKETCSICFETDKTDLVRCPECEIIAHRSCLAQWADNSNIGILNVFRCHNCYNLLKLDRDYINKVRYGKIMALGNIHIERLDLHEYQQTIESEKTPEIVQAEDPLKETSVGETDFGMDEEVKETKFFLCPNCSKMITNRYKYCPNCGTKLK
jgi:hypothetical protein